MAPIDPALPATDPRVTTPIRGEHPSRDGEARPDALTGSSTQPASAEQTELARLWRFAKGLLVFLIVTFHLVVLAIRNPLDLWYDPITDWLKEEGYWKRYGEDFKRADIFTWKYTNLVGCEQRWSMFGPPMARRAPFLGFRFEFTDGSTEFVRSEHEPARPDSYFRIGGWQDRKLEDYLASPPDDLVDDSERPLWEATARRRLKQWQQTHPDDPRKIHRLFFLRRRISFPKPDEDPSHYEEPTETVIAAFDASGKALKLDKEGKVVE